MAAPWLALAFKAVPWSLLLRNAPQIVRAADALTAELKTRRSGEPAPTETLESRVAALERHHHADAEVLKQMAEQIEALTTTSAILARRLRLMTIVLAGALVVIAILLFRGV